LIPSLRLPLSLDVAVFVPDSNKRAVKATLNIRHIKITIERASTNTPPPAPRDELHFDDTSYIAYFMITEIGQYV